MLIKSGRLDNLYPSPVNVYNSYYTERHKEAQSLTEKL